MKNYNDFDLDMQTQQSYGTTASTGWDCLSTTIICTAWTMVAGCLPGGGDPSTGSDKCSAYNTCRTLIAKPEEY